MESGSGYIGIHQNIVAETASHDKEMKYLMTAEGLMPGIENRQLQGVNDTPRRIDQSAREKPAEG